MSQAAMGDVRAHQLETLVERIFSSCSGKRSVELHRRLAAWDWSVFMILAHLAELLPYWAHQACDVAMRSQNDAPFGRTHDDPDRIAAVEARTDSTLEQIVPRVRAALSTAAAALRTIPAEGWVRTGRHARRGEMTVQQIVDQFLVEHVEEHLHQAEAVLRATGDHVDEAR